MRLIILLITSTLFLQGCIFVAGAAAGAAGIAAVYDHRTIEKVVQDQKTSNEIISKLNQVPNLSNNKANISVATFNQVVLLTGEASTPELKEEAGRIAGSTPCVVKVYNQIAVHAPSSGLSRTSDTWITTKIKSKMLATQDLKSGSIKVVTENGTVYLMGIVTHEQANMTVNIARDVSGVQRVVKVFQYKD